MIRAICRKVTTSSQRSVQQLVTSVNSKDLTARHVLLSKAMFDKFVQKAELKQESLSVMSTDQVNSLVSAAIEHSNCGAISYIFHMAPLYTLDPSVSSSVLHLIQSLGSIDNAKYVRRSLKFEENQAVCQLSLSIDDINSMIRFCIDKREFSEGLEWFNFIDRMGYVASADTFAAMIPALANRRDWSDLFYVLAECRLHNYSLPESMVNTILQCVCDFPVERLVHVKSLVSLLPTRNNALDALPPALPVVFRQLLETSQHSIILELFEELYLTTPLANPEVLLTRNSLPLDHTIATATWISMLKQQTVMPRNSVTATAMVDPLVPPSKTLSMCSLKSLLFSDTEITTGSNIALHLSEYISGAANEDSGVSFEQCLAKWTSLSKNVSPQIQAEALSGLVTYATHFTAQVQQFTSFSKTQDTASLTQNHQHIVSVISTLCKHLLFSQLPCTTVTPVSHVDTTSPCAITSEDQDANNMTATNTSFLLTEDCINNLITLFHLSHDDAAIYDLTQLLLQPLEVCATENGEVVRWSEASFRRLSLYANEGKHHDVVMSLFQHFTDVQTNTPAFDGPEEGRDIPSPTEDVPDRKLLMSAHNTRLQKSTTLTRSSSYLPLFHTLSELQEFDVLMEIFTNDMVLKRGIQPDRSCVAFVMDALVEAGRYREGKEFVQWIYGLQPKVININNTSATSVEHTQKWSSKPSLKQDVNRVQRQWSSSNVSGVAKWKDSWFERMPQSIARSAVDCCVGSGDLTTAVIITQFFSTAQKHSHEAMASWLGLPIHTSTPDESTNQYDTDASVSLQPHTSELRSKSKMWQKVPVKADANSVHPTPAENDSNVWRKAVAVTGQDGNDMSIGELSALLQQKDSSSYFTTANHDDIRNSAAPSAKDNNSSNSKSKSNKGKSVSMIDMTGLEPYQIVHADAAAVQFSCWQDVLMMAVAEHIKATNDVDLGDSETTALKSLLELSGLFADSNSTVGTVSGAAVWPFELRRQCIVRLIAVACSGQSTGQLASVLNVLQFVVTAASAGTDATNTWISMTIIQEAMLMARNEFSCDEVLLVQMFTEPIPTFSNTYKPKSTSSVLNGSILQKHIGMSSFSQE